MRSRLLKTYCARLAKKIALVIYAGRMVTINSRVVKRFAARLFRSARDSSTEEQANNALFLEQTTILGEYRFYSASMWKFCGSCVIRLLHQLHDRATFQDFPRLRSSLFHALRKASDDADINARVDAFFTAVHAEV